MFIISDSHVSEANGNVEAFFEMLAALEARSEPIVFLGDIFDLWISLPRYQEACQERFLDWCRERSRTHEVGFIEGNHEFFMVRRHRDCFTWSDGWGHQRGSQLFVHGDTINRDDHNYLRWRKISKNAVMRTFVRFLPGGPKWAHKVKAGMKKTNDAFRYTLPESHLEAFAMSRSGGEVKQIFVGHFHTNWQCEAGGVTLEIVPDWFDGHQLAYWDGGLAKLRKGHWANLLKTLG